jgi:HAD superfamily hydrolase (TIGR01509 family)
MSKAGVGVVFDLDGVLVDSEHLWERGWTRFAGGQGYSWTAADTAACQGMSVGEWDRYLGERTGQPAGAAATDVVGVLVTAYRAGEVSLLPGARDLVEAVAARVPVALASSAPRPVIDVVMDTMGLRQFFAATVSSAEVERGKPNPDVYVEAVRRLGIDSAGSYAVEDSGNGVRAAAAAGLAVIAVPTQRYPLDADAARRALRVERTRDGVREALVDLLGPRR